LTFLRDFFCQPMSGIYKWTSIWVFIVGSGEKGGTGTHRVPGVMQFTRMTLLCAFRPRGIIGLLPECLRAREGPFLGHDRLIISRLPFIVHRSPFTVHPSPLALCRLPFAFCRYPLSVDRLFLPP
jgi:hypothetical protein